MVDRQIVQWHWQRKRFREIMFQSGCSKKWLLDIRSKSEDSNDNEEEEEDTKFRAFSLQHGRKVVLVT